MQLGILGRYLLREVVGALAAVAIVLLAIMNSVQFGKYLAQAAGGTLPKDLLLNIVALTSLQYLMLLMPFSALMAVMLALGRLYKDQEIAAMAGCGVGGRRLYFPFLLLALGMALVTAALSFQVGPWAGRQADMTLKDGKWLVQFNPFEAGRFKEVGGGRAVFYTESLDESGNELGMVFGELREESGVSVLTARAGRYTQSPEGGRHLVLEDGWRYQGEPGQGDYDITHYQKLQSRIQLPEFVYKSDERKTKPTLELLKSNDPGDLAEWHWRLSAPIGVFLMVLLAVPLSHIAPRQGRYSKLVVGIVVYFVYVGLLAFGQKAIEKGRMPDFLGLWWVHVPALLLAMFLIARREGWLRR